MTQIVKTVFLLASLCVGLHSTLAQKRGFQHGYIIEKSGDTLKGYIKDRSPEPFVSLFKKVRFIKEGSRRTRKYGPEAILGYGDENDDYVAIPFREEVQFLKFRYYSDAFAPMTFLRVIRRSEELIYYEQQFVQDDNNYLNTVPFFHKPSSKQMVRVTQGLFGFRKKHIVEYFSQCPALIQAVNQKNPEIQSVMDLYEFCLENCAF
ncbi:MAG: hypothetical protein AAFU57_10775 [Bacteroidota bacterium]